MTRGVWKPSCLLDICSVSVKWTPTPFRHPSRTKDRIWLPSWLVFPVKTNQFLLKPALFIALVLLITTVSNVQARINRNPSRHLIELIQFPRTGWLLCLFCSAKSCVMFWGETCRCFGLHTPSCFLFNVIAMIIPYWLWKGQWGIWNCGVMIRRERGAERHSRPAACSRNPVGKWRRGRNPSLSPASFFG